jgi:hypothetical protein
MSASRIVFSSSVIGDKIFDHLTRSGKAFTFSVSRHRTLDSLNFKHVQGLQTFPLLATMARHGVSIAFLSSARRISESAAASFPSRVTGFVDRLTVGAKKSLG